MMLLAILALQTAAVFNAPVVQPADDAIIIKSTRLRDAQLAWENCLQNGCKPDDEMRAAIRFANAQFLEGDFPGSRQTLAEAQRRNNRYAKDYPLLVSDLARANSRVSSFDGRPVVATSQSIRAVTALKQGLDSHDALVMMQRLETGDQMARDGRLETASSIYRKVAADAKARGLGAVRGHALLRDAVLFAAKASVDSVYRSRARAAVARIEHDPDPAMEPFREGVAQLDARLAALTSKPTDVPEMAKANGPTSPDSVALLYEPLFDYQRSGLTNPLTQGDAAEWADIAFWIRPDGSVDDVEVRQTSRIAPGAWLPLRLKTLGERRYTPFQAPPDAPGLYRVERYAMVHDMVMPLGTHVYVRSQLPRMEAMDLSSTYRGKTVAVN